MKKNYFFWLASLWITWVWTAWIYLDADFFSEYMVGPPYPRAEHHGFNQPWIQYFQSIVGNPPMQRSDYIHCFMQFYVRSLCVRSFWYPWGWGFCNQSSPRYWGTTVVGFWRVQSYTQTFDCAGVSIHNLHIV